MTIPIKTGVAYIKDFDDECKRKIARISYQIFCLWVIKKIARHLLEHFSNLGHWLKLFTSVYFHYNILHYFDNVDCDILNDYFIESGT